MYFAKGLLYLFWVENPPSLPDHGLSEQATASLFYLLLDGRFLLEAYYFTSLRNPTWSHSVFWRLKKIVMWQVWDFTLRTLQSSSLYCRRPSSDTKSLLMSCRPLPLVGMGIRQVPSSSSHCLRVRVRLTVAVTVGLKLRLSIKRNLVWELLLSFDCSSWTNRWYSASCRFVASPVRPSCSDFSLCDHRALNFK